MVNVFVVRTYVRSGVVEVMGIHFRRCRNLIEISCLLLKKLLLVMSPKITLQKYSANIERSLRHPDDLVKSSILSEVKYTYYLFYRCTECASVNPINRFEFI